MGSASRQTSALVRRASPEPDANKVSQKLVENGVIANLVLRNLADYNKY